MTATPASASVAARAIVTADAYVLVEQVEPSQLIEETGACESMRMSCDFAASTLPALSHERYLTVVVAETVNGPVYVGLATVGVEPSVV